MRRMQKVPRVDADLIAALRTSGPHSALRFNFFPIVSEIRSDGYGGIPHGGEMFPPSSPQLRQANVGNTNESVLRISESANKAGAIQVWIKVLWTGTAIAAGNRRSTASAPVIFGDFMQRSCGSPRPLVVIFVFGGTRKNSNGCSTRGARSQICVGEPAPRREAAMLGARRSSASAIPKQCAVNGPMAIRLREQLCSG